MFFKYNIIETILRPDATLEPFILKSPKDSYYYAKQVLKKPWKKAESVILEDPEYAYLYAKNVLKRRWDKAEELILDRSRDAVNYGYWGQEKARMCATMYAVHVIKGRWKEAELHIANDPNLGDYINKLTDEEAKAFKNVITLNAMDSSKCAKKFFSWRPTHRVKMKGSRAFDIMLDNEPIDRWGHRTPTGKRGQDPSVSFTRAFTLKEWLGSGATSIEFSKETGEWYWKRMLNQFDWNVRRKKEFNQFELKGTVTPLI